MEQWSGAQQALAVKAIYQHGDESGCRDRPPSAHAIAIEGHNFKETSSAIKKVPTAGNIEAVQQLFGGCIISCNCDVSDRASLSLSSVSPPYISFASLCAFYFHSQTWASFPFPASSGLQF